jgi:acyl-CoA thioesterase-2
VVDPPGTARGWLRLHAPPRADPVLQACALAYLSDDLPTDAVVLLHPDHPSQGDWESGKMYSASLDHAIWFHRPVRTDEWMLVSAHSVSNASRRGFAHASVHARDGRLAASIAQEVLLGSPQPRRR